jgi:ubiquinol-cytochrome c reductase cytochrome c subunit
MASQRSFALAAALSFAALVGTGAVFGQTGAPVGDAKLGQALYMRDGCYECHGTVAQGSGRRGSGGWGPMLAPHPLPFSAVLAQLRRPRDVMPAYSALIVPDQDVASIYAYLATIPAGKSASDIALLRGYAGGSTTKASAAVANTTVGEAVYTANCSSCHGVAGAGQPGVFPPLANNPDVTGSANKVIEIVNNGLNAKITVNGAAYQGTMPGWKQALTTAQVAAVITYIRTSWGNQASPVTTADVSAAK